MHGTDHVASLPVGGVGISGPSTAAADGGRRLKDGWSDLHVWTPVTVCVEPRPMRADRLDQVPTGRAGWSSNLDSCAGVGLRTRASGSSTLACGRIGLVPFHTFAPLPVRAWCC